MNILTINDELSIEIATLKESITSNDGGPYNSNLNGIKFYKIVESDLVMKENMSSEFDSLIKFFNKSDITSLRVMSDETLIWQANSEDSIILWDGSINYLGTEANTGRIAFMIIAKDKGE